MSEMFTDTSCVDKEFTDTIKCEMRGHVLKNSSELKKCGKCQRRVCEKCYLEYPLPEDIVKYVCIECELEERRFKRLSSDNGLTGDVRQESLNF